MKTQFTYFKNVKKVLRQKLGDEETTTLLARAVYLSSISRNDCSVGNDCYDPRKDKFKQARQRRKGDRSLLNLQKRLFFCNGNPNRTKSTETTTTRSDPGEDVAPVVLPVKLPIVDGDQVSVFETFAPAIKKLGGGSVLCDDDDGIDGEKMVIPTATARRPTVHFKFKSGKKFIGESLDDRNKKRDALHAIFLVGRENERDDEKWRAEYILDTLENPQELPRQSTSF